MRTLRRLLILLATLIPVSHATLGLGDELNLSQTQSDLFENHLRPIFVAHCIKCHGATKQEGGLNLTSYADLLAGGDSGPAIVPGQPDDSLIVQAVRYESLEMPPDSPLQKQLADGLSLWVAQGAPWPADVVLSPTPAITDADRDWWCYQPIAKSLPPPVDDHTWARNEIDAFILQRLSDKGLHPATQASPIELTRRVSFAITGMPPDQEAMATATKSASVDDFDYEQLVDRLLLSASYGENQARLWLDLVRYADTDGYRADFVRPDAKLFRDYVIRSFNADKPYDRFISEQLAGDEIDPGNRDAIIATMYLRHWIYEHNQRDVETQWHEILNDITETTSDVFLAQGLKCARCHDHKFDPLLQKDYFRIKAFFAAFQPVAEHPVADIDARREYQTQLEQWKEKTQSLRDQLRKIEYPVALEHATREGFAKFIPEIKAMIKTPADKRSPYEKQIAAMAERQFDLPYDKLDQWLSEEQITRRGSLKQKLAAFEKTKPKPLPSVPFTATDVSSIAPATFIPDDSEQSPIAPGFLTLLDDTDAQIQPTASPLRTTGRRTTLAKWITSPENPLTARVIVNRIWQQHFGRGLVATSSDFGRLGAPPTHPLLLDYLAQRLIRDNWSLKKLHRLILTSATYRQTSRRAIDRQINRIDPANAFLWRMNPRRLTGEEIHDAILNASGELASNQRAIYQAVKRNSPDPLLTAFDGPDRIRSSGKRHRTTTSTQSLLLANSDWAHARATAVATRFADSHGISDETLIKRTYRALFARDATNQEIESAAEFINQYAAETPAEKRQAVAGLETMPFADDRHLNHNQAVRLRENGPEKIELTDASHLESNQFTIEAVVLLDSLYPDASVRTIASTWNGSKSVAGWSLGVTSKKSSVKPRNLILQFVGTAPGKKGLHYEVVASNLRVPVGKPCQVAARVNLSDTSDRGLTFYLRDLSVPNSKFQTANVQHTVASMYAPIKTRASKQAKPGADPRSFWIGSRNGNQRWDGLIGHVRLENSDRDVATLAQADSVNGLPLYSVDFRFDDADWIGRDSSGNQQHATLTPESPPVVSPRQRARVAFVHALLNSNELIYVD